jgi:hypothetical protein
MTDHTVPTNPTAPNAGAHPGTGVAPTGGTQPPGTPASPPSVRLLFGVTFEINGKPVTVTSSDVANIAKKGFEFRLPEPVTLGTFDDLSAYLNRKFQVNANVLHTLPDPFHGLGEGLATTVFTVEEFHVMVPPSPPPPAAGATGTALTQKRGPTMYTLLMSATPPKPIEITSDFQVERFVFGISNEPEPGTEAAATPVPGGAAPKTLPAGAPSGTNPSNPAVHTG